MNILAHKALLAVYGDGAGSVEAHHIRAAARDTDGSLPCMPRWLSWWPLAWSLR